MGSGRQYMSWIHRIDWVEMVRWLIETPAACGPFNATAPEPVTNRQFARALGRALRRPSLVPAPGFALRLMLGELADPLLLTGQRVVPAKARRMDFHFRYPTIEQAFRGMFGNEW
jgi:NAD dependent epimerase/dehydratase family enzyme